jgi:hypothetical protein
MYLPTLIAAVLTATAVSARAADSPPVPPSLQPPAGSVLKLSLAAKGVQIYQCQGTQWKLQGPDAKLFDAQGRQQATHYAGPTWEASDGSKVIGEPVAHDDGPDSQAVPWLLLQAKTNSGQGLFSDVRSIQRLHTIGGRAPAAACGAGNADQTERVVYSADYYFYTHAETHGDSQGTGSKP